MSLLNDLQKEQKTTKSNGKDKISYIYIYGPNHSKGQTQAHREAYPLTESGGDVREAFKNTQYDNLHGFMSYVIAGLGDALTENDYSRLFDTLMVDADVLAEYFERNPEMYEAVTARVDSADEDFNLDDESDDEAEA